MDTALARVSFQVLTDEQLLEYLRSEEDRLPRTVVDEMVKRGESMLRPLSEICWDERSWKQADALFWTPVHATFILGALGEDRAIKGLMASLRWSARYNVDWVYRSMPAILGMRGRSALDILLARARESEAAELDRTLALHCLGALAAHHPVLQGEILDFLKVVVEEGEEEWIRNVAACILLKFVRPADRKLITVAAIRQAWSDQAPLFTSDDVKQAYEEGRQNTSEYLRDWLDFYRPDVIRERERRWQEKAEDDRWGRGADERAPWVHETLGRLLNRYESSLVDAHDEARGDALWVAESMTEYLIWNERLAPWRWTAETAYAFLMDYLARRISMDDAGRIRVVPENLLRFVQFCVLEGYVSPRDGREVETTVAAEKEDFVEAARDPATRRFARRAIEDLLTRGKDPADPAAAGERSEFFLSTVLAESAFPGGVEDRSALSKAELGSGTTRRRPRTLRK
jgi:hypothetical protein